MDIEVVKELMSTAERVLNDGNWKCPLFTNDSRTEIYKSYDGQTSALGVSVLTIGLRPTLAVYYHDEEDKSKKPYRRAILEVIARMLNKGNAETLVKEAVRGNTEELKTDVLNCSVALKQVIRTYTLVEYKENDENNG